MSQPLHDLLKTIIQQTQELDYPDLSLDAYFEIFAAQQVIKDCHFDLDPDEIESGVVGGGDDGGVDAFYVFANRKLVREDTDLSDFKGQQLNIEVIVIQAKNKNSFEESVPSKFKDFVEQCLRSDASDAQAQALYSEGLRESVLRFHLLYKSALMMKPTLSVGFFHVAHSDQVHPKVETRGSILCERTKEFFPTAKCHYVTVTGHKLITLFHQQPDHTLQLKTQKYFDWNSFDRQAYVCVVHLADFYSFITNNDELREYIFEANVRDHAPDVKVNKGIQATLSNPEGDDFWWLNNGITIISSGVIYNAGALQIANPMIVNGLQTSYEVFHHFKLAGGNKKDQRTIMLKVIVNTNEDTSDRIISATNSQTKIDTISLHATEQIQRSIEITLKAAGFFYDRRKNFYRNQGKPVSRIVTIPFMAQAVAAIVLQQPDQARARPGTVAEKSYALLFDEAYPIGLYPKCIQVVKKAQKFLTGQDSLTKADNLNLVFYLAMYAVSTTLGTVKPKRQSVADLDMDAITDEIMQPGYEWILLEFLKLGGDDRAAKGPVLAELLRQHLLAKLGKKKIKPTK